MAMDIDEMLALLYSDKVGMILHLYRLMFKKNYPTLLPGFLELIQPYEKNGKQRIILIVYELLILFLVHVNDFFTNKSTYGIGIMIL